MQLIPVIDIRNGVAVRAVAGKRAAYQPLETPLAASCAPLDVAQGLMSLHPFRTLYIADLDAIERRGDNIATIETLSETFLFARLWVDTGFRRSADSAQLMRLPNVDVVFGSESLDDAGELCKLRDNARAILSLDFSGDVFLGDVRLLSETALWPQNIIVMTLARVGSGAGPDLGRLREIAARASGKRFYAAGGVRGPDDLMALQNEGAAGALIATALHEGRLTRDDLARLDTN